MGYGNVGQSSSKADLDRKELVYKNFPSLYREVEWAIIAKELSRQAAHEIYAEFIRLTDPNSALADDKTPAETLKEFIDNKFKKNEDYVTKWNSRIETFKTHNNIINAALVALAPFSIIGISVACLFIPGFQPIAMAGIVLGIVMLAEISLGVSVPLFTLFNHWAKGKAFKAKESDLSDFTSEKVKRLITDDSFKIEDDAQKEQLKTNNELRQNTTENESKSDLYDNATESDVSAGQPSASVSSNDLPSQMPISEKARGKMPEDAPLPQASGSSNPKRIHSVMPTFTEVGECPELAYSDHLPIYTNVDGLRIISNNILGNSCSGIHKNDTHLSETLPARYRRIAQGLHEGATRYNAACLLLQEVSREKQADSDAQSIIMQELQSAFGEHWHFDFPEEANGVLTGYDTRKLRLSAPNSKPVYSRRDQVLTHEFENTSTNEPVVICNSWGGFDESPTMMEEQARKHLEEHPDKKVIFMGDLNTRLAPVNNNDLQNLVTGSIPSAFIRMKYPEAGEGQVGDQPDGGFVKGIDGEIEQLVCQVLDPATGELIEPETDPSKVDYLPHSYKMITCLDHRYQTMQLVGDKTIFQYQELLRNVLGDKKILVRVASTTMNEKAIAITFTKSSQSVYKKLVENFKNKMFDTDTGTAGVIFVPMKDVSKLLLAMDSIIGSDKSFLYNALIHNIQAKNQELIALQSSRFPFFDSLFDTGSLNAKTTATRALWNNLNSECSKGESNAETLQTVFNNWMTDNAGLFTSAELSELTQGTGIVIGAKTPEDLSVLSSSGLGQG